MVPSPPRPLVAWGLEADHGHVLAPNKAERPVHGTVPVSGDLLVGTTFANGGVLS